MCWLFTDDGLMYDVSRIDHQPWHPSGLEHHEEKHRRRPHVDVASLGRARDMAYMFIIVGKDFCRLIGLHTDTYFESLAGLDLIQTLWRFLQS